MPNLAFFSRLIELHRLFSRIRVKMDTIWDFKTDLTNTVRVDIEQFMA
jgi:hypothetical protein